MEEIRSAIEKASGYLAENPDAATGTDAAATAVREEGLRFRVEGPKGSVTSDMSESVGGGASAPTPGWLLRAALAACDATLVAMEAARDGIELSDLTVSWRATPTSVAFSASMAVPIQGRWQSGRGLSWRRLTPPRISSGRSFGEPRSVRRSVMQSSGRCR